MFKNLKDGSELGVFEMEGQIMWASENRMSKTVIKSKLKKWDLNTNKHFHLMNFGGSYIEFYHQVRFKKNHTSEFDTKSSL